MAPDPYETYLRQAEDLFEQNQVVKAGQIWQAILKQQPGHALARERLLVVKQYLLDQRAQRAQVAAPPLPEPPPASPSSPPPVSSASVAPVPEPPLAPLPPAPAKAVSAPDAPDPDRLLAEGCTLYDMGQLEDALKKWELLLQLDPAHRLAKSYANGTRRELGLPLLAEAAVAAPAAQPAQGDEDLEKLLREAVQLYDMGLTSEAISKWERVLALDPQQVEVQGYLQQARKELSQAGPAAAPPPPPVPQAPESESLELKLRQAEHLLSLQRHEEAAFTFQQALRLAPGDAAALAGLERCRRPARTAGSTEAPALRPSPGPGPALALDSQKRIEMVVVTEGTLGGTDPGAIAPPPSLTQAPAPTRRGLPLPERLRALGEQLPWLSSPRTLALLGGGALLAVFLLFWLRGHFKDQELARAVQAAKDAAIAPLAQQTQAMELTESPTAVREEAEAALAADPLRAYLRAEHLVARVPGDAAAAQLFEQARAHLPGGVTGASLAEFEKHLQHGDLEAAAKVMDALLRAQPGDASLRNRATRLYLGLCAAHVGQGKWEEAREDLLRGRALVPGDKTWQARLLLLERVKAMPKVQRPGWIPLLG